MARPLKVRFVSTGLLLAGAEGALYRLLGHLDRARFEASVVSLTDDGHFGPRLRSLGIPVHALGMRSGRLSLAGMRRLRRLFLEDRPDIVQTWMYHADLVGGLVAKWCGIPVVWSLRQSELDPKLTKLRTRLVRHACATLSWRIPSSIVCCSHRSRTSHVAMGYSPDKMVVIPNGFDMASIARDSAERRRLREELSIPGDSLVVGHVARLHPQKDHRTFIAALSKAMQSSPTGPRLHAILCGAGISMENPEVAQWVQATGMAGKFHLLGARSDATKLMSGMDLLVVSSAFGEGFPNVIAEAMCNETPCVSTDVGDASRIVGDTGVIVPPSSPEMLARAITDLLASGEAHRAELGRRARKRIADYFGIEEMVRQFQAVYDATCPPPP